MTLHATLFCIKIESYSAKPETHAVTVPIPDLENTDEAWEFSKSVLADFLPRGIDVEEKMVIWDDDDGEQGFFFSCSDADSDDHYHVLLKYTLF